MGNRIDPEFNNICKEYKRTQAEKWRAKDLMVAAKKAYFCASERVRCEEEIKDYALKHKLQAKIEDYNEAIEFAKQAEAKAKKSFESAYEKYKKAKDDYFEYYKKYKNLKKNRS